jgi:N-methylhydantoinase A
VTDANVVLGYLDATAIAGGEQPIDRARAEQAVRGVAEQLDMPLLEACFGIHAIANQNMGRAIRRVSIERGRDPRGFAVIAFGGAGPVHAVAMARDFGIRTVLIPVYPGVFSAIGLFLGGRRYDLVQSWADHGRIDVDEVAAALEQLKARSTADSGDGMRYQMFLDMRYEGQGYELKVPLAATGDAGALAATRDLFHAEHARTFGYRLEDDHVEIASARLRATLPPEVESIERLVASSRATPSEARSRTAYFGPALGAIETPVIERWGLTREPREGPLIVEDMDATTVVPPGSSARLGDYATIVVEVGERDSQ